MNYFRIAFLIVVISLTTILIGCKSKKIILGPESQKNDNVDTGNQDGGTMDYEQAVQRHYDMQSNRTKQMMSDSKRKNKTRNYGLNRTWYDQLFNNSCNNNSCMVKVGHEYRTITNNSSCFIKK